MRSGDHGARIGVGRPPVRCGLSQNGDAAAPTPEETLMLAPTQLRDGRRHRRGRVPRRWAAVSAATTAVGLGLVVSLAEPAMAAPATSAVATAAAVVGSTVT